jgi:D-alanyl-lipoteichoic acid acyltransferase DltB (MBOAT superfamily)
MIDPVSFLVLLVVTVGLSHVVLPQHRFTRLFWITAPGFLLLFITHQRALGLAIVSLLVSAGIYVVGRTVASDRVRTRLPYVILLLLFAPDLAHLARETPILFLGSAFFIIRQMMTVAQALKSGAGPAAFVPALLIATFFVAALPSGPVFNGLAIWKDLQATHPPDHGRGLYRLFEGFVHLFALGGIAGAAVAAIHLADAGANGLVASLMLQGILLPIGAFALLFTTFYGYSRMAEGTALLLGFSVPQNFDRPHLAIDLGDYWKRWHRSMADFVMQYIYLPLLVTTRRSKVALSGAFVFMGLWHNLSPSFLIWGLGHGLGLGLLLPWARRRDLPAAAIRIASLLWVVGLSSIAHGAWA